MPNYIKQISNAVEIVNDNYCDVPFASQLTGYTLLGVVGMDGLTAAYVKEYKKSSNIPTSIRVTFTQIVTGSLGLYCIARKNL